MNSTKATFGAKNGMKLGRFKQIEWYMGNALIKRLAVEVDENANFLIPTTPIESSIYLIELNNSAKGALKHLMLFAAILAKQNNMRVFMVSTTIYLASSQPPAQIKAIVDSAWDEYWAKLYDLYNFRKKYW
jgi:hypothetical protein